jgi:hypothetical protein
LHGVLSQVQLAPAIDRRVVVRGGCRAMDELVVVVGPRFLQREPRERAGTYARGLLAGLEPKNGPTLVEHAGAVSPDGMQRLLRTANWDVEGVSPRLPLPPPRPATTYLTECRCSTRKRQCARAPA